ncbi:MAG: aminotransferase class I/II-fold pyridoxal phosphate-dependent enzyme [Candidatus Melainabacteria bacterium]|nr:aminotransferase class I/II-fold pyridoxal phosphate-dependent enzyme [Candidatus Melainabacteria bacterium]
MLFETRSLHLLEEAVNKMQEGFDDLPTFEAEVDVDKLRAVMLDLARRLQDNYPYQHPLYAGQMLKPPHSIARLAYMLTLWVNPNNHALDGGRATSNLEKEAVANIAAMFGFEQHLGHLCGGGTMANLEALWVAGSLHHGKIIVASEQAHYTHSRISAVLGLQFAKVAVSASGRMDIAALEERLIQGNVGTVVVTAGTTSTGSVDSLKEVLKLREKYQFRIHVDAAYGGYFILAGNLDEAVAETYALIKEADSVVIDPHKHGYQPYGCGCVLFKDPAVGALYKHDSPYTYFSSAELHLGEISLECSRPGASAAALWATQQMFPLEKMGQFATNIEKCRQAALQMYDKLKSITESNSQSHSNSHSSGGFFLPLKPDLDILIYAPIPAISKLDSKAPNETKRIKAPKASEVSALSRRVFNCAAAHNLHLALATLPSSLLEENMNLDWDQDSVTVLRSCFIKHEHSDWIDSIAEILVQATEQAQLEMSAVGG